MTARNGWQATRIEIHERLRHTPFATLRIFDARANQRAKLSAVELGVVNRAQPNRRAACEKIDDRSALIAFIRPRFRLERRDRPFDQIELSCSLLARPGVANHHAVLHDIEIANHLGELRSLCDSAEQGEQDQNKPGALHLSGLRSKISIRRFTGDSGSAAFFGRRSAKPTIFPMRAAGRPPRMSM